MQISTKLYNERALGQFNQITSDIQNTQARIATGKQLLRASDDPSAAVNIAFAKEQKEILARFDSNIDRAQSRLALTESTLGDAINLLTRVQELAIQARNDTYSVDDRKAIGAEVSQLKETLMGFANTRDTQGKFLFSGYRVHTQPFVANDEGGVDYHGDRGLHAVQISETMKMKMGIDGAEAFLRVRDGDKAVSVFSILTTIEDELNAGFINAPALDKIDNAISHLSIQRTGLGAQMNKGEVQKSAIAKRMVLMDEDISRMEDADLAKLVTELQSKIVNRDAAQQAFVKIGQQSLFDFIR